MVQIDSQKFQITHKAFLKHMEEEGDGVPFTSFGHRFFVSDEVSYKQETLRRARNIVRFSQWDTWSKKPGRIVEALKEACKPAISSNLMEHRYGEEKNSYSSLYKLDSKEDIRTFEEHVRHLYSVIQHSDDQIAPVFDELAKHLHENKLGCKWVRVVTAQQNIPVLLTQAQRKVIADLLPKISDHLKLNENNSPTISFTTKQLESIREKAEAAHSHAETGIVRNSLRHIVDAVTKDLDNSNRIGSIPASERLYQFKITLLESQPQIWRRIQIKDSTLDKFHERIQTAMGWTNSHLHQFEIDGEC